MAMLMPPPLAQIDNSIASAPLWPSQGAVNVYAWGSYTASTALETISGWVKNGTGTTGITTDGTYMLLPTTTSADTAWYVETSNRVHYAEAQILDTCTHFPLCVRLIDHDNFVGVRVNAGTSRIEVYQRVAATFTSLASLTYGVNSNSTQAIYRLEATADDQIKFYANGNLLGTYTCPSALTAATKIGAVVRVSATTTCRVGDLHWYAGKPTHGFSGSGTWCWFAEPRAIVANGKTFVSCVTMGTHVNDGDGGGVKIIQIDNVTGNTAEYLLRSSTIFFDDHANGSIAIRSDGRLVAFYAGHLDTAGWRYRVSVNAYDVSAWSQEYIVDATDAATNPVTYMCGMFLTGDSNKCYVFFRQGAGVSTGQTWLSYMVSSDLNGATAAASDGAALGSTPTWSASPVKVMVTVGTKGVYFKPWSNGVDRIDFAVTDAEAGDHRTKTDVRHFWMKSGATFWQTDGQPIAAGSLPVAISALTGAIATSGSPDTFGDVWVWDCYREATSGEIFVVFARFIDQYNHQYYYARWNGTAWSKVAIPGAVTGPLTQYTGAATLGDGGGNYAETYYSPGVVLDSGRRGVVYAAICTDGSTAGVQPLTAQLWRYMTLDDGVTWRRQLISPSNISGGRYVGKNFRPVVPRLFTTSSTGGGRDSRIGVVWVRGSFDFFNSGGGTNNFGWHSDLMYSRF